MPRKGENIYKRKDGRWEGRYIKSRTPAGKANYGYVYAKTYREVKSKLVNQISFASNSTTANQKVPTVCFECIAMEWFQTIHPQIKESSSNKYWNLLNSYVLPALCDITHDFIEEQCNLFLTEGGLKGNGLSAKTVSDILSLIRNIMQFAAKKGNIISCNAQSIQIKRQIPEMRVLSRAEQEKLCQYLYWHIGVFIYWT